MRQRVKAFTIRGRVVNYSIKCSRTLRFDLNLVIILLI